MLAEAEAWKPEGSGCFRMSNCEPLPFPSYPSESELFHNPCSALKMDGTENEW